MAVAGTVLVFGVGAVIASVRTKDYFGKHVRAAEDLGYTERMVQVRDGLVLNIAEGTPGGIPLLLIPGQGCVWQEYCKALPEVTATYRVLIADVHGHGQSTWNSEDYTGVQIAEDMCALIEEVFGEPAVIAGHSSGGLIAALMAALRPAVVRGVVFEDAPFFSTLPERVPRTYVGMATFASAQSFRQQSTEDDWVCWYMPRSYWTASSDQPGRSSLAASSASAEQIPNVCPLSHGWEGINRIWESLSHPFDVRFTASFADNSWFRGFDQAQTLAAIACPTTFVKASTRHDGDGNLLAALSDEDLSHVEELLPDNQTVRVNSSHDIHFAQTKIYTDALNEFAARV